eukprot:TRINITY_DN830_c0_g1_i1.p1 TRINITY_DN830_c0_g1~~TRINITY_DN830_c0_g1_i1.p1  ORF type:complete len:264 (+),score=87.75 TRINITY_DN830_c0_g1_i1:52-792(+)
MADSKDKSKKPEEAGWRSIYLKFIGPLINYIQSDLPPGPKFIPMRWYVNFQKCCTGLYVLALMYAYNNFSLAAYLYLALHGTYGLCWFIKELIFPDPSWMRPVTVSSMLAGWAIVLGPYWIPGYIVVSQNVDVTPLRACVCVVLHTLGVVTMIGADCQKFFTLKYKKGLISEGWFARSRNINYLGEMMLYSTYAILAQHIVPWIVLTYVWILLFLTNMVYKDISLSKKEGWAKYKAQSGFLFPKLF